ncbi:MAG: hypothetical protein WCF12_12070 [Propionicimonas sp.]
MIRRLSTGLAGLAVLALALVGLPAFLLGAYRQLAGLMPALDELPSELLAPGDGGLFLLTLLAIGWICWLVFVLAFVVELVSRARGIRTPRLGPFIPQHTAAWAVTAVTLLATLAPAGSAARATSPPPSTASVAAGSHVTAVLSPAQRTEGEESHELAGSASAKAEPTSEDAEGVPWRDYRVRRGDSLWDIADRKLGEPTEWPVIAEASRDVRQPGGGRLEDPDLILTGWILHIPTPKAADAESAPQCAPAREAAVASQPEDQPAEGGPKPPVTPLRPPEPSAPVGGRARGNSAPQPMGQGMKATPLTPPDTGDSGDASRLAAARLAREEAPPLATPLRPGPRRPGDAQLHAPNVSTLALPAWVQDPLIPTAFEDAPPRFRSLVLAALATRRGLMVQGTE